MGLKSLMWILWPSFLAAAVGSAVVFALIDPLDVAVMGYVPSGRVGFYTVSFFFALGDGGGFQCVDGLSDASGGRGRRFVGGFVVLWVLLLVLRLRCRFLGCVLAS